MKSAEDFVNRLFEEQQITRELCVELKLRIAQVGQFVPADSFSQRLVDKGVISQSVANRVLIAFSEEEKRLQRVRREQKREQQGEQQEEQQRERGEKSAGMQEEGSEREQVRIGSSLMKVQERAESGRDEESQRASSSGIRSASPTGSLTSTGSTSSFPSRSSISTESSSVPWKKKKGNSWESIGFLLGGSALFVLVIVALVLYSSIYQHSAEFVLEAAQKAYDSGNYVEAVRKYTEFLDSFPKHSEYGTSKIRLSLAKMRLTTEGRNDWLQSLDVAQTELGNLVQQTNYREEAQPELNAMLPSIAEHLSESAREKPDLKVISATEDALLLIQKYVPVSEQSPSRMERIRANLELARLTVSKEDRFKEDRAAIEKALKGGEIETVYRLLGDLLRDYPQIATDPDLQELVKTISQEEQNALRWVDAPLSPEFHSTLGQTTGQTTNQTLGQTTGQTTNQTTGQITGQTTGQITEEGQLGVLVKPVEPAVPAVILANRIVAVENPATRAERVLFVLTGGGGGGSLFGVRSTDGTVLWKKEIGNVPLNQMTVPEVYSFRYSGAEEDGLIVDYQNWELVRFNAKNGEDVFRVRIGEPFRLMSVVENAPIVLTTETGKLWEIDPKEGTSRGYLQLPQHIMVAPVWDKENNRLLQLAPQSTLYIAESGRLSETDSSHSFFLGHSAGSVRVAPFLFGPFLVVAEQIGPDQTLLRFFQYKNGSDLNNSETDRSVPFLQQVQTLTIPGIVQTAPVVDRTRLFLATNTGQIFLFDCDPKNDPLSPIRLVAKSTVREGNRTNEGEMPNPGLSFSQSGTRPYLGLYDQTLWCSGDQLVSFDVQQSRERFVPKFTLDPVTKTLAPLRRLEDVLFRVFQHRNQQNTAIKAFSLQEGKTLWETQLTDPVVQEPVVNVGEQTLQLVTQSGKMYEIPLAQLFPTDTVVSTTTGSAGSVVSTTTGSAGLVGSTTTGSTGSVGSATTDSAGSVVSTTTGSAGSVGSTTTGSAGSVGSTTTGSTGSVGSTTTGSTGSVGSTTTGSAGSVGSTTTTGSAGSVGSTTTGSAGSVGSTTTGSAGSVGSTTTGSAGSVGSTGRKPLVLDRVNLDLGGEKRGQPIREIIPLARNFQAWIELGNQSKSIPVFDPDPSNARSFRFIPLDSELQTSPIAFGQGLLVPLKNGQVQLLDPKTGFPMTVDPFVGKIVPNQPARWSTPLANSDSNETESPEFFIIDQNLSTLYQVALVKESDRLRFQTVSQLSDLPVDCDRLTRIDKTLFAFSMNNGEIAEITLPKLVFRDLLHVRSPIIWGPYTVQSDNQPIVLFATRNNTLHLLSLSSKNDPDRPVDLQSTALPQSAPLLGKPLVQSAKVYLLLANGMLLTYDPTQKGWGETIATGIIPQTGPIAIDNRILLTGKDGCLYWGPTIK
ncbi:MAG: hypothetical protein ACRC10_08070 [Thermoguttaceae bacterium]